MSIDPRSSRDDGPGAPDSDRVPLIRWARQARAVDDVLGELTLRLRRRRARRVRAAIVAVAAVAVLVTGIVPWTLSSSRRDNVATTSPSRLIVSQPSRQQLPDGSTVELRPGAEISVEYSDRVRRVTLRRGEAHFQVAKNPAKPFVVIARGVAVSALGTAFCVDAAAEQIEVLVTEGRVAVERAAPDTTKSVTDGVRAMPPPVAVLDAGKRLVVTARESAAEPPAVQVVTAAELSARLAWRVPRLEFSGTPLGEIVPAVNRHSRVRITVADAELNAIRLSGTLRANDTETLVGLLEEGYGLRVERRGPNDIVVLKRR